MDWQDAFTCEHELARVGRDHATSCSSPQPGSLTDQRGLTHSQIRAAGWEKDGQSSAPRHWALGTVQLRREGAGLYGAVSGRGESREVFRARWRWQCEKARWVPGSLRL